MIYPGLVDGEPGSISSAMIVHDGIVVYLRPDRSVQRLHPELRPFDLRGRLVTPAFVDAHVHLVQTGQVAAGLDLSDVRSVSHVLERVAQRAQTGRGAVIVGSGWDERTWPDPRPPTRTELDTAAPGRVVYLARVDVHSAVVSSELLRRCAGVERLAGYASDGLLRRDAHHRARVELDALFGDGDRRAFVRVALGRAAARGIGTVHDMGGPFLGPESDLDRLADVADEVGVRVVRYWGALADANSLALARRHGVRGLAGDLSVDGAIGSHTAALTEPYRDFDGRGYRYLDDDQIAGHLLACTEGGVQAGFHCIGDEAVDAVVRGLRVVAERLGVSAVRACRHRLEHLEMPQPHQLATLASLGVVASVQPGFDAAWGGPGELYEQRLGARATTMNPFGDFARAGVPLAFGSDSPVTPLSGWGMVRAAVRHSRTEQRLGPEVAFDAATRGGQWAAGRDGAGTLAAGSPADLAVWDLRPDSHPIAAALDREPRCLATVVAGRWVHGSPDELAGS